MSASETFQVHWSGAAVGDLESILGYIAEDDRPAAMAVLDRLEHRASTLVNMPERGRIVPELREQGITVYRELVEPPWRILYRIESDRVWVLAVIDGRRNVEDILLERLTPV